jgi:capsular polysaccharide biosynthesis protein
MRFHFPFFWRPSGVVSSLADLPVSDTVPVKKDVSVSVGGKNPGQHPLIVAELKDGKIIGDLRLAATSNDVVIGGVQTVFGCADLQKHYALRRRRFRIPKYRHGKALLLGAANSDNYYHWLLDSVPRWKMMLAANQLEYDYVLLHSKPSHFQNEVLDRLQVPPAKRLWPSKNFVHQFERLVVPAMPFPEWQIAPWICEYVRSIFPSHAGGPEKIYLARRGAQRRRLVNELELEAKLQSLGFVSVQPEKMTVAEQAKLFGSAKYVVASHGAGLTNMVFAPVNALLVELFHPDVLRPTYKNLAAACGLQYIELVGRRLVESKKRNVDETAFTIDINMALQVIEAQL